ncbi:MAG: nucleotide exchange factor GrpE [Chloroflexota bacterium]|nr:nucleotide exchange factor GrpE [Chloroflexota bacterium]
MKDHPTNGRSDDGKPNQGQTPELEAGAEGRFRRGTRAEERVESIKTPTRSELLEQVRKLEAELEAARAQADDQLRALQRTAADFSNYRRRTEEERTAVTQLSNALLIGKLLAVLDDFDRALASVPDGTDEGWLDGIRLVERKLRAVLEGEGVTPIEAVGEPFDPNLHEAVVHEDTTEYPDNTVIDEVQRGYRLHDRILRPALVRVANNPATTTRTKH